MFKIKTGDLFESKEKYLCHQCNCLTNRSAHLAKAVFSMFPYADVYSGRTEPDKPGSIEVRGSGAEERYVVAMFAQYYPGRTKFPTARKDGWAARLTYFKTCLGLMEKFGEGDFAFPWRIGCGAAGGNWDDYLAALMEFENKIKGNVTIYQLESFKPKEPIPTLF